MVRTDREETGASLQSFFAEISKRKRQTPLQVMVWKNQQRWSHMLWQLGWYRVN